MPTDMAHTHIDDEAARAAAFTGPVKHSITISGHQTSISLEPLYWAALRRAAAEDDIALNALVAQIDENRIRALTSMTLRNQPPANLASAIRSWLWLRYTNIADEPKA